MEQPEEFKKTDLARLVAGTLLFVVCLFTDNNKAALIISAVSYLLLGWNVLKETIEGISEKNFFDENQLMFIATVGAFAIGEFKEGVAVMLFYSIGEILQDKASDRSMSNIRELMNIEPKKVHLVTENGIIDVLPDQVESGSVIRVFAGESVPIDGILKSSNAQFDTSKITGESVPLFVSEGQVVISASIVLDSPTDIITTCLYENSTVSKIMKFVEDEKNSKSKTENFITSFARIYTPIVVISAGFLFLIPSLITGNWSIWLHRALSFLVISCPCSLVISIPLSFFSGIGCAAKNGILVKGGLHLQNLAKTSAMFFDKTGTITEGKLKVEAFEGKDISSIAGYIYTAESQSTHPVAKAVCQYVKDKYEFTQQEAISIHEERGKGITARFKDFNIICGNSKLVKTEQPDNGGKTFIHIMKDNEYIGHFVLSDTINPTAQNAVLRLKNINIPSYLLSGDNEEVCISVAEQTGMNGHFGGLLPLEKAEIIEGYQKRGEVCTFTGDGINDTPAMVKSDCSIAMGKIGSDSVLESAGIVLASDNLEKIPDAISIARKTMNIAKQNIVLSISVKSLFLILSAMGISGMLFAVLADTGLALLCILNSTRAMKNRF